MDENLRLILIISVSLLALVILLAATNAIKISVGPNLMFK